MKLLQVLYSQSVRLIRSTNPMGTIYMPDAVKGLQERYGFLQVPTNFQEYNIEKGVAFGHGKFTLKKKLELKGLDPSLVSESIVIDKFQIFPNGLLVDTKSFVESADLFLDDVIQWGIKTFGLRILEDPPIRKAFVSHLEVKLDSSPLAALAGPLGNKLMACLKSYGVECPPMEGSNLSIHCDTTNMPAPVPSSFSLERRAGFPYSSNIYFSAAPLTTLDHLKILSTF